MCFSFSKSLGFCRGVGMNTYTVRGTWWKKKSLNTPWVWQRLPPDGHMGNHGYVSWWWGTHSLQILQNFFQHRIREVLVQKMWRSPPFRGVFVHVSPTKIALKSKLCFFCGGNWIVLPREINTSWIYTPATWSFPTKIPPKTHGVKNSNFCTPGRECKVQLPSLRHFKLWNL